MHGGASTGPRTLEGLQRIVKARTVHGAYGAEMRELRRLTRSWTHFRRGCGPALTWPGGTRFYSMFSKGMLKPEAVIGIVGSISHWFHVLTPLPRDVGGRPDEDVEIVFVV